MGRVRSAGVEGREVVGLGAACRPARLLLVGGRENICRGWVWRVVSGRRLVKMVSVSVYCIASHLIFYAGGGWDGIK